MRILFTADTFPPRCGGSGWSAYEQARALIARGHSVTVLRPGSSGQTELDGVPVIELSIRRSRIPGHRHLRERVLFPRRFRARVAEILRSGKFDILHAQHSLTGPASIRGAHEAGVPSVLSIRDYWPTCLWGTKMSGDRRCPGCSAVRIVTCVFRNSPLLSPLSPLAPLYVPAYLRGIRREIGRSTLLIAISERIRRELAPFVTADRIRVIPNMVAMEDRPVREADRYITFAGKMTSMKGIHELLHALREVEMQVPVVFIGDGPLRPMVEREIAEGRVRGRVAGWLDRREMLDTIAGGMFNLFPSRWDEPLGRVIIEAASVGRTSVILSPGGLSGPHDILEDGVSGIFTTTNGEFGSAIAALAKDPSRAAELGRAARERVRQHFSDEAVCPQLEAAYASAAGR